MRSTGPQRIPALGDILAEHARSMPERTAVVCGNFRATWLEADARVSRAAAALSKEGVGRGDRVLWLGQNCHRLLESLLACARLGATLCPANWRCGPDELVFVAEDVEPTVVLWQGAEIGETVDKVRSVAGAAARWVRIDGEAPIEYEELLEATEPPPSWFDVDADDAVVMIYTAAHDGRPNGALLSHRAWVYQNLVTALVQGTTADDTFLCSGPLFHVGTLRHALSTFQLGGCNVVARRVDAELLCRLVQEERCTVAFLEKPTMEQMVEVNRDARFELSSLRTAPAFDEWDAMVSPEVRPLRNGFGQTELAGLVTFADTRSPGIGRAGRSSPIAVVEVLDASGNRVEPGGVGEIVVRGPMVMNGYHRRPELNEARRAGGWHHTSDLGRRETDGTLTFVGPATRIVKSASENIYPAEVEACLRGHPAVLEAAVIGVPDEMWTQSVLAVVVLRHDAEVSAEDVIEHCRQRIASYKKPKIVEFVGSLPRTGSGAVDYDALDQSFGGGGYPSR